MVDMGVVLEELGRAVHPGPFLSSAVVGGVHRARGRARAPTMPTCFPAWPTARSIGTLALLEPDARAGWRVPGVRLEGDRLTGTKVMVPDAVAADIVLVAAAVRATGSACSRSTRGPAGCGSPPTPTVDGTRKHGTVVLDGAPARRLGELRDRRHRRRGRA